MGIVAVDGALPDAVSQFLDTAVAPRGREHWQWKYAEATAGAPRAFYHLAPDGAVTGFVGLLPSALLLPTGTVPAAWIVDWVAAGAVEGIGTGLALLRRAEKAAPLHFVLGASTVAREIYARLRWNQTPVARVWLLPLSVRDLARRGPARRPALRGVVRVAARVARHYWRVPRPRRSPATLREVSRFPAAYDAAFVERQAEFAPLMDRDSGILNHRCADYPDRGYRLFLVERRGRPAGHLVLRIDEREGLRRGRIIDLLWPRREAGLVEWLVHEAAWRLQEDGVDYVECVASAPDLEAALRARRFYHRSTLPIFYHALPPEVAAPGGWFVTYLDADRAYR